MTEVISKFVDEETNEKWQAVRPTLDSPYPLWIYFYRSQEDDGPYCAPPFTAGAEGWLRGLLNERVD